jgi:amino acid adenylation domain-containing protein
MHSTARSLRTPSTGDREAPAPRAGDSIASAFAAAASKAPDRVAVDFAGDRLTYRELNRRSNQLAAYLRRLGVSTEDLVGLYCERSTHLVVGMLGILKAGAGYVPLDPAYPADRLDAMRKDAGIRVLLCEGRWSDRLRATDLKVVRLDSDRPLFEAESAADFEAPAAGQNLAYVIYTSGSTGRPKGIAVPHAAVLDLVLETDFVSLTAEDRVAQISASSFDAATFEIWGALLNGARLVGFPQEAVLSPREFAARVLREEITCLFVTTALFNQIARSHPEAFSGVKHVLFGGERVDAHSVREVLRKGRPQRLLHVYGPTETTTFASWHLVADVGKGEASVPIGRPIARGQIRLAEDGSLAGEGGESGEIFIGGPGLARGYLGRPDLTAERFLPDPAGIPGARLYRSGDNASRNADGSLEFIGRRDTQVKLRGFRIELGEIERELARHPAVGQAVVVLREEPGSHSRLVAYVLAPELSSGVDSPLRAFLAQRLPSFMVPAVFVAVERFPLNTNGKVDRERLPPPVSTRPELRVPYVSPDRGVERLVADIWKGVLGVDRVGRDDNFFELGGNSLLAAEAHELLCKAAGASLSITTIFRWPTVASFARGILALQRDAAPAGTGTPPALASARRAPTEETGG